MSSPATSPINAAERLLDLVIALTHTTHRMTRSQIRAGVNGYAQTPNDDAFMRMFERDKETLRELGVPLVTEVDHTHGDDVGYRIDLDGYEMPAIELTPEEIGVLSVAAAVWQGARLDGRARRGLTKLRAVAPEADPSLSGHVLRIPTPEAHFDALLAAISQRRRVTFDYAAAHSGTTARRVVEPWRLLARDGAWYLQAWDTGRDAERLFRLSRVVGRVRTGEPGTAVGHAVGPAPEPVPAGEASLLVREGRAASLRLRAQAGGRGSDRGVDAHVVDGTHDGEATAGWDRLTIPMGDLEDLAALVAGHTDAVVVLDPPALREAVLARLRAVAALAPGAGTPSGAGASSATGGVP